MDMEKSDGHVVSGDSMDDRKGEQHLQELEVDVGTVLQEEGEFDFESDQSPFPEGMFCISIVPVHGEILTICISACCGTQCRRPRYPNQYSSYVGPRYRVHNGKLLTSTSNADDRWLILKSLALELIKSSHCGIHQ